MTSVQSPPQTPSQLFKEPPGSIASTNGFHDEERPLMQRSNTAPRGGVQRKIIRTASNMTTAPGIPSAKLPAPANPSVPLLILQPLNDTFLPKSVPLPPNTAVRIGRQTNAKTQPHPSNGYFDSKVLSRAHAEVWSDAGKVYIKDVKSSNGTFVNGQRLSLEGVESDPFELNHEDIVEFGIDIVGDDTKTIVHHKVSARVLLGTGTDQRTDRPGMANRTNSTDILRRGAKNGINLDVILNRLHTELKKARETGGELEELTGSFGDIQQNVKGRQDPKSPLGDISSPAPIAPEHPVPTFSSPSASSSTIANLQTRLSETQLTLSQHVERVAQLEKLLTDHEQVKSELESLRLELQSMRKQNEELSKSLKGSPRTNGIDLEESTRFNEGETKDDDDQDDDTSSILTITPDSVPDAARDSPKINGSLLPLQPPAIPQRKSSFSPQPKAREFDKPSTSPSITTSESDSAELKERLAATQEKLDKAVGLCEAVERAKTSAEERVRDLEARAERLEKEMAGTIEKQVEEKAAQLRKELLEAESVDGVGDEADASQPGLRRRKGTVTSRSSSEPKEECQDCIRHKKEAAAHPPGSTYITTASVLIASIGILALLNQVGVISINLPRPGSLKS